jgi:hypothetical protein
VKRGGMKYWLDTEFIEDPRFPIELISIGIVAEDGREYYAEVDLDDETRDRVLSHDWLMANVWPHLDMTDLKSKDTIANEVWSFCTGQKPEFWGFCSAYDWVVLNQLYGTMVAHPPKWAFYCNDIAQLAHNLGVNRRSLPEQTDEHGTAHNALADARWTRDAYLWLRHQGAVITDT